MLYLGSCAASGLNYELFSMVQDLHKDHQDWWDLKYETVLMVYEVYQDMMGVMENILKVIEIV